MEKNPLRPSKVFATLAIEAYNNKCVGPPYSRIKIYAAGVLYASDDAHRPPLHRFAVVAHFAAAARATAGTH